jgi:hypothetical protein
MKGLYSATVAALMLASTPTLSTFAADPSEEVQPAPAAIGTDMPLTYFGPQPSSVQRELVGEYQTLKAGKIDVEKGVITLPLYEGAMKSGQTVWYIVTDTDDKGNADGKCTRRTELRANRSFGPSRQTGAAGSFNPACWYCQASRRQRSCR